MTAQPKHRMTVPEFLDWASRQQQGRYELVDGVIVAMSPERARHARAEANAWLALRNGLARARLPCEAFSDGMTIVTDEHKAREPDAAIQCKPVDPDSMVLDEPIVVVEVVSPSSAYQDSGPKLSEYFGIPSVRHYLMVDPSRHVVTHYWRQSEGTNLTVATITSGPVELTPPGFVVAVEDMIGFAPDEPA